MAFVSKNPRFTSLTAGGAKDASTIVDMTSTTQGLGLANMTTTQRDAISTPKSGLTIWNTTTSQKNHYNGSSWEAVSTTVVATPSVTGTVTTFVPVIKSRIKVVSSAAYTVLDTDGFDIILVTTGASSQTITLPTAADNTGRTLKIRKVDTGAGTVIIDGEGGEAVNSAATNVISYSGSEQTLFCDGTAWSSDYEEHLVAAGGDLTGNIVIVRTGNLVTLTSEATLTHSSDSSPDSGSGVVPARFRPVVTVSNCFGISDNLAYISLTSAGTFTLSYFDVATGAASSRASGVYPALVSYIVGG